MVTKTCKICGETKEAIQGVWVFAYGKPVGRTCLKCVNKAYLSARSTVEGRAKYNAISLASCNKRRATPEGRVQANEVVRKLRNTETGLQKSKLAHTAWQSRNPAKVNALTTARRAAKLKRTAPWADAFKIAEFYALAQQLTKDTGISYVVDHIVPLQGKLVSGLHVHNNLQILTKSENSAKCNKFDVDAFNNEQS